MSRKLSIAYFDLGFRIFGKKQNVATIKQVFKYYDLPSCEALSVLDKSCGWIHHCQSSPLQLTEPWK